MREITRVLELRLTSGISLYPVSSPWPSAGVELPEPVTISQIAEDPKPVSTREGGCKAWPARLGLVQPTHVDETRLDLVGAGLFWRPLGFLLCHLLILIEHAQKQSVGTTSMCCCCSYLPMAEFITLWLSAGDKSALEMHWKLVSDYSRQYSSGWLVFGVWLVGWSMLEHVDLKQVRSGTLIGNKQQPSSLAEPETDDCKV